MGHEKESGSAGPAVRPCGSSSDAGSCRVAHKVIQIIIGRAVKTTARWKNRKAGERALRYIFIAPALVNGALVVVEFAVAAFKGDLEEVQCH